MPEFPETYREVHVDSRPHTVADIALTTSNPNVPTSRFWVLGLEAPQSFDLGGDLGVTDTTGLSGLVDLVGATWETVDSERGRPGIRSQFIYVDPAGTDYTPIQIHHAVQESPAARFVVPVYFANEFAGHPFMMVPDSIVVTVSNPDAATMIRIGELAGGQGFGRVASRTHTLASDLRIVLSSRFAGASYLESERYRGEPGPAMELVTMIREEFRDRSAGLVRASHDWFVIDPNTEPPQSPAPLFTVIPSGAVLAPMVLPPVPCDDSQSLVKIAVLDGEFDLGHDLLCFEDGINAVNSTNPEASVGVAKGHAHGTLCAGIIGGRWAPSGQAAGVYPAARIGPVSVYSVDGSSDPDEGFTVNADLSYLTDGIRLAVEAGYRVLSISVGGYLPEGDLLDEVRDADNEGAVLVSGTGNVIKGLASDFGTSPDGVLYPAKCRTVLAVGAAFVEDTDTGERLHRVAYKHTDGQWDRPWQSRYGRLIDVVAPGIHQLSTDLTGAEGENTANSPEGDFYKEFAGTSCATPFVAAAAALILEEGNRKPVVVRSIIRTSARRLPGDDGGVEYNYSEEENPPRSRRVGHGMVDRKAIVRMLEGLVDTDVDVVEEPSRTSRSSRESESEERIMYDPSDCGCSKTIPEGTTDVKPYIGMFRGCLRPLTDFLNSLGSDPDEESVDPICCYLAAHFWQNPYRTAMEAGLPWHAAVMLGQGDWEEIYAAVAAERHRSTAPSAGPIWVRAG